MQSKKKYKKNLLSKRNSKNYNFVTVEKSAKIIIIPFLYKKKKHHFLSVHLK
jgi:hypothetical protein